jgi:hypothetical protein
LKELIPPDALDPIYQAGTTYYLVPDGPVGQKAFAVLRQAMLDEKRHGIGQVVLHGREHVVLVRPVDHLLAMTVLSYENQIKKPATFEDELIPVEVSNEELGLAKTLIEVSTPRRFDYSQFEDEYTEKLTKLIEAKVAGKEIVAPPVHEQAQIINLMDALKESVAKMQGVADKPAKKMAPSRPTKAEPKRRRKSSRTTWTPTGCYTGPTFRPGCVAGTGQRASIGTRTWLSRPGATPGFPGHDAGPSVPEAVPACWWMRSWPGEPAGQGRDTLCVIASSAAVCSWTALSGRFTKTTAASSSSKTASGSTGFLWCRRMTGPTFPLS